MEPYFHIPAGDRFSRPRLKFLQGKTLKQDKLHLTSKISSREIPDNQISNNQIPACSNRSKTKSKPPSNIPATNNLSSAIDSQLHFKIDSKLHFNPVSDTLSAESIEHLVTEHHRVSLLARSSDKKTNEEQKSSKEQKSSEGQKSLLECLDQKCRYQDAPLRDNSPPNEDSVRNAYHRLLNYAFSTESYRSFFHQPIDYVKLWDYGTKSPKTLPFYAGAVEEADGSKITAEERIGLLTEQSAHSIVERLIRMKQFGDNPADITPDEQERYDIWRKFTNNKALRSLWEKTSAFYHNKNFLPMLSDDAKK